MTAQAIQTGFIFLAGAAIGVLLGNYIHNSLDKCSGVNYIKVIGNGEAQ